MSYTDLFNNRETRQTERIPGRNDQVQGKSGGFIFQVDDWARLNRFLILGSDKPTYYSGARELTRENASSILNLLKEDGVRVVNTVVDVSTNGRAYKNDPALFVLALALANGDDKTKAAAREALPKVARIGTHLFTFVDYANDLRGWGSALAKAVRSWYEEKDFNKIAYQVTKYNQRSGWSHIDVMRKAHPQYTTPEKEAVFRWLKGVPLDRRTITRTKSNGETYEVTYPDVRLYLPEYLEAVDAVKRAETPTKAATLIRMYNLPREVVPTEFLKSLEVWDALLTPSEGKFMPMTAMVRNLGVMTANGFLTPMGNRTRTVVDRLMDREALVKARVHPMQILAALFTYKNGQGARGRLTWTPVAEIVDALDEAFYLSFGSVEPTGKRRMFALDVSGSMTFGERGYYGMDEGLMGVPGLSPRIASSALAMVAARTEKQYITVGFTGGSYWNRRSGSTDDLSVLNITPRQRLDDVLNTTANLPFGGTDCALPMLYALENNLAIDSFEIFTDSETWAGSIQPVQALDQYKRATGIDATLTVVAMTSNGFTIADPTRTDNLDVVGFDSATPNVISDFVSRRI